MSVHFRVCPACKRRDDIFSAVHAFLRIPGNEDVDLGCMCELLARQLNAVATSRFMRIMRTAKDKNNIAWIDGEFARSGITIHEFVKAAGFNSVEDAVAASPQWYPGSPRCLATKDFAWRSMVLAVPEVWPAQNNQHLRTVAFTILDSETTKLPWQPVLETLHSAVVWSRPRDNSDLPRPFPTRASLQTNVLAAEETLRAHTEYTNDAISLCAWVFAAALDNGLLFNVCSPASRESIRLTCQAISIGITLEYTPQ